MKRAPGPQDRPAGRRASLCCTSRAAAAHPPPPQCPALTPRRARHALTRKTFCTLPPRETGGLAPRHRGRRGRHRHLAGNCDRRRNVKGGSGLGASTTVTLSLARLGWVWHGRWPPASEMLVLGGGAPPGLAGAARCSVVVARWCPVCWLVLPRVVPVLSSAACSCLRRRQQRERLPRNRRPRFFFTSSVNNWLRWSPWAWDIAGHFHRHLQQGRLAPQTLARALLWRGGSPAVRRPWTPCCLGPLSATLGGARHSRHPGPIGPQAGPPPLLPRLAEIGCCAPAAAPRAGAPPRPAPHAAASVTDRAPEPRSAARYAMPQAAGGPQVVPRWAPGGRSDAQGSRGAPLHTAPEETKARQAGADAGRATKQGPKTGRREQDMGAAGQLRRCPERRRRQAKTQDQWATNGRTGVWT